MDRDEIPPCRPCGKLREQWKAERAIAEEAAAIEAGKPKPPCLKHYGQDLDTCRSCAADRKAAS